MPTLPRSKADSPQKTSSSRHGSPHKASPQKSPKKISKGNVLYLGGKLIIINKINYFSVARSQSVGPTVTDSLSPKRQPKPMSSSVTASTASSAAKTHTKKTPVSTPTSATFGKKSSECYYNLNKLEPVVSL